MEETKEEIKKLKLEQNQKQELITHNKSII